MSDTVYKIRPASDVMSEVSFEVKSMWALGMLSAILQVPKKHLRTALEIIKNPKLEAEILEKKKLVKRTFHYGFREFKIKRKGKERQILAPHPKVQLVFKSVKNWLESLNISHQNAFGFVKDKNPKKAVVSFLGNKHFVGFDIADAFPSITAEMVRTYLRKLSVSDVVADVLAWLVTYDYESQRRLPQGSSCSPIILNLVYRPMCDELQEICRQHGIIWNVYADDFNFTGQDISLDLKAELLAVPVKYGFQLKDRKTRDNAGKTVPHILGLTIVDEKIHINCQTKNRIRRIIYAAGKFGAYSVEQVAGRIGYVRHIYGEKLNWPGSILKIWQQYQQTERRM